MKTVPRSGKVQYGCEYPITVCALDLDRSLFCFRLVQNAAGIWRNRLVKRQTGQRSLTSLARDAFLVALLISRDHDHLLDNTLYSLYSFYIHFWYFSSTFLPQESSCLELMAPPDCSVKEVSGPLQPSIGRPCAVIYYEGFGVGHPKYSHMFWPRHFNIKL